MSRLKTLDTREGRARQFKELFTSSTRPHLMDLLNNAATYTINAGKRKPEERLVFAVGRWFALEENGFYPRAIAELRVGDRSGQSSSPAFTIPLNREVKVLERCMASIDFIGLALENAKYFSLEPDGEVFRSLGISTLGLDFIDKSTEIAVCLMDLNRFRFVETDRSIRGVLFEIDGRIDGSRV